MEQDIKQIKEQEKKEDLEKEVQDVQAGRIIVEEEAKGPAEKEEVKKILPKKRIGRGRPRRGRGRREREDDGFEQKIIDLARVTRVTAGGKRLRFRACVAVGDRNGQVGIGLAKGQDVTIAISKAVAQAKKDLLTVPLVNETIPHEILEKFKAAKILLKPARLGKGIIAGGAVRTILELAGIPNVVAKILGTSNKISNVRATINALKKMRKVEKKKDRESEKGKKEKS